MFAKQWGVKVRLKNYAVVLLHFVVVLVYFTHIPQGNFIGGLFYRHWEPFVVFYCGRVGDIIHIFQDCFLRSGSAFIKPDQRNPWIKDQIKITLLPTISHLLLPNFVSCGRACPSHMTQNLVTVGAKLWTADRFIVDPWSMDYADPVW